MGDTCGARAVGGPCVLHTGHNMGRADVPENHLAHDLAAFEDTFDGLANTCPHDSATGVDRAPISLGKVWRCDHCGLKWTNERGQR